MLNLHDSSSTPALIDTVVLSDFAAAGRLDLLAVLIPEAFVTRSVGEEVRQGAAAGYAFMQAVQAELAKGQWLRITDIDFEAECGLVRTLPARLHQGEADAIAVASY